jgi:hypothetical protein
MNLLVNLLLILRSDLNSYLIKQEFHVSEVACQDGRLRFYSRKYIIKVLNLVTWPSGHVLNESYL